MPGLQATDMAQKGLCENVKEICKIQKGGSDASPTKMLKSLG